MAKPRSSTEEPTQRIPRETLAECAAYHRAQLELAGLVAKQRTEQSEAARG